MIDLLKFKKCPISGFTITTKPEWKYKKEDCSYSVEIGKIGYNTLYVFAVGSSSVENNIWFIKTINTIIDNDIKSKSFSIIFDYTYLETVSFQSKKTFISWAKSIMHKVQAILFFGMTNKTKLTILTAKKASSIFDKVFILDSYEDAIQTLIKGETKYLNKEQAEKTRINELIGYLGKMTWTNNLNQEIPVLPNDDPIAELFAAVAANQEDLREIDKDRNEALKELAAQKELVQKSEEYYRTLIENSIDAISVIDIYGNIVFQSKSAEKLLGYTNEKPKTKNAFAIVHPDDRKSLMQFTKENSENYESVKNIEFRAYHKNGSIRYIEGTAKNMLHSDAVKGIVLNYRDVTDRKKAEQALNANETLFRTVADFTTDWEYFISPQNEFLYISPSCQRITGYSPDEFKQSPGLLTSIVHSDDVENWKNHKHYAFDKAEIESIEFRIITKSGQECWIGHVCQTVYNKNGVNIGIRAGNRDISERKQAEETLKASKENYRLLTETMKDVVVRISTTGELLYLSPAAEGFGGYMHEEEVGGNMFKFFAEEKDCQRAVKLIAEIVETAKSGSFEFLYKAKNNTTFPVELTYVPLIKLGEVYAIQMVLRDITERKNAEEALIESNKTKDKFFSIIAHDLKSPFNSMLGFAGLLKNEFDDYNTEEKKKFIGIIYGGLQNTLKLLDDLLSWARSQKGTIAYNPEKVNLCLMVDEICVSLNQTIENKSIQIINRITENTYVEADRDMLATIIRNLLSNAIKFTNRHGQITISTIPTPSNNNNQFAGICVSDTGVGISKEAKSKLFDITENSSTKGTEGEKGTGLGLILCKEFVEKHGGKIWVESEVGNLSAGKARGSSFFFTIPH